LHYRVPELNFFVRTQKGFVRFSFLSDPAQVVNARLISQGKRRNMKRLITGLGLSTILLLLNFSTPTQAEKTTGDEAAVRATVTDYIEGYFTGDAARMEKAIHPHYLKHTISGQEGALKMTEKTGLQMVQEVRAKDGARSPETDRKQQITVLDVHGDIASARLVTAKWVDYLTLAKWNGQWKIVSVVLREND
jgi:hypothetical protein